MYFPHKVIIVRKSDELDRKGQAITLGEETCPCRISEGSKVVKNRQGEEVVTMTHIMLPGHVSVSYNDELRWTSNTSIELQKGAVAISTPRDGLGAMRITVVDLE